MQITIAFYALRVYIRANDLDVDEFLDHPLQTIKEDLEENFYKDSKTTELIKDKTGAEAVYALETDPIANAKYGNLSTPRVVESLYCLEKDPILGDILVEELFLLFFICRLDELLFSFPFKV